MSPKRLQSYEYLIEHFEENKKNNQQKKYDRKKKIKKTNKQDSRNGLREKMFNQSS